jgi:hypothetical protein
MSEHEEAHPNSNHWFICFRWNFSVGQHELTYLEGDEDATISACPTEDGDSNSLDAQLKVFVPNGMVVAVDENDPTNILWKFQV